MSEPVIDEESKRVSLQVTSLSTQLIESVEKQSRLEEQLHHQRKENEQLKKQNQELSAFQTNYQNIKAENEALGKLNHTLGKKLEDETKEKLAAKDEVSKLQSEVEELSASLFDEANKMVSTARREAHEIGRRNESLISQLKEKDFLMESLQNQLRELKNVIHEKDDQQSIMTSSNRNSVDEFKLGFMRSEDYPPLYTPTINAIRFDLKLFKEFNKFISDLKYIELIRDTNTKFIKKLVADDVEPALRIDLANGIGWLSKRSLMGAFIDGRVIIEPVSGINETYRVNFQSNKSQENDVKSNLYSYPAHSPPVAIDQPCALCGEDRNDILEHSRLYVLKVHSLKTKDDSPSANSINTSSTPSSPIIAHQYPLCSYCLFRVRSACDLFAFLRSLKTNIWKLENEISIRKAWLELSRLRSKLFWSKIGIWDLESNIQQTRIYPGTDDVVFKTLASMEPPKPTSANTLGGSSLNESFGLDEPKTPSTNNYKSSPLINQINADSVKSPPENPITLKEKDIPLQDNDGTYAKQENLEQSIPSVVETTPVQVEKEIEEKKETPKETSKSLDPKKQPNKVPLEQEDPEDDDDITNDILNDYSQSEDEDSTTQSPSTTTTTEQTSKTKGLMIQTQDNMQDRPQDDLLYSEENTPIVNPSGNFSDVETPTKTQNEFDFVSDEKLKVESPKNDDVEVEAVKKSEEEKRGEKVDAGGELSREDTDNEEDFVDA